MNLKNLIKIIIRDSIIKLFRLFGYVVLKKWHKDYAFNKVLKRLIADNRPLIFDVGADDGSSCERYSKLFKNPIIHAFEPRSDQFEIIKSKFDNKKNIIPNNFAVGSRVEIKKFNQINGGGRSSFLRSTVDNLSNQIQIDVQVTTIDEYVNKNNLKRINLLKIDTQGYEDEVLKGAKKTLESKNIDIIEIELIIGNMYEKTLSFNEIENLIYPYGYKFFAIVNQQTLDQNSSNLIDQPNLQLDIIYTQDAIHKKYAYGKNFFQKNIYRTSSETVEEFMRDKLIRK